VKKAFVRELPDQKKYGEVFHGKEPWRLLDERDLNLRGAG